MTKTSAFVYQRSITAGTGNLTLVSVAGFRTYATAFPSNNGANPFFYCIRDKTTGEYENGLGYLNGSGDLVRATVLESSNSGSAVDFSDNMKDITCDVPAIYQENIPNVQEPFTTAEKTKLSGIQAGATLNQSDAYLLARANHTGTQAISTVTGLEAALDALPTVSEMDTAIQLAIEANFPPRVLFEIADVSEDFGASISIDGANAFLGANLAYSLIPPSPSYLSIDSVTGEITGTAPIGFDDSTVTVQANNSAGTKTTDFQITVSGTSLSMPVDFRWTSLPFTVYQSGSYYSTNWTPDSVRPTGVTKYFSKTGSDSNDGNTPATAYRTLEKGRTVNTNVYMIGAGFWDKSDVFTSANYNPTIDVAFIAYEGKGTATLSRAYNGLSWTQYSGSNAYYTTAATVEMVLDLTAAGQAGKYLADGTTLVPQPLTLVASIAACQSTAGSYYVTGTTVYVHTHDNRVPDSNVKVLAQEGFVWFTSGTNQKLGYEGLNLFGRRFGRTEHATTNTNTFYMYQCYGGFSIESAMSPVRIQGTKYTYVKDCGFSNFTLADACSLSMGNTASQIAPPNALFENVIAWNCGSNTGANNFNAFTGHYGANAICVNCSAENFYGPLYTFVLGAHGVFLNCDGTTSLAPDASLAQQSIFQSGSVNDIDGTTRTKIWMKDCSASGVNYGRAGTGGATIGWIYDWGGYTDTTTKHDYAGTIITTYP